MINPGGRAPQEEGIESPPLEAGLTKNEIRELSKALSLPTWNKPATPLPLFPDSLWTAITVEALEKVRKAETFIRQYGLKELRVRNHAEVARIEIQPDDFHKLTAAPPEKK